MGESFLTCVLSNDSLNSDVHILFAFAFVNYSNMVTGCRKRRKQDHGPCVVCGATESKEWRRGLDGQRNVCNSCGLHIYKQQKKLGVSDSMWKWNMFNSSSFEKKN